MAKRFIDTEIFKKPQIRSLQAPYKLLYVYMFCECNHAGIWDVELDVASLRLGCEYDEEEVLKALEGKIHKIRDDKWYLIDFVEFQYGTLNPDNRAHKSVIDLIKKYKIKPLTSPSGGCKDKDKDKELDKKKDSIQTNAARIGTWFRRRVTTKWSDKEIKALKAIGEIDDEDFQIMEDYYTANIHKDKDYRRRDVQTLLNNWTGELDRAIAYKAESTPRFTQTALPEPEGWRKMYLDKFGEDYPKGWNDLSVHIQRELL